MFGALDLTIAIPVKNEGKNLSKCLSSIGKDFASHIVLIDSGSTDSTCEIAREFGVTVIEFEWNGKYPKKRNWFLKNFPPETKWIMFLDADEYLTDEFKSEMRKKLFDDNKEGYLLTYSLYFMGRKLRGGRALRKIALFQTGKGEYERINEESWSALDMEVHEKIVVDGTVGVMHNRIDHQDYRGISHWVLKHDEYSSWEAERYFKEKSGKWTWKQHLKYRLLGSFWMGPAYFLANFIILGGLRDGVKGFCFSLLKASYFIQVYCKIKENSNKESFCSQVFNDRISNIKPANSFKKKINNQEAIKIK